MSPPPTTDRPLLVTGFEAFGPIADNPSQRIVERLAARASVSGHAIVAETLPTEYERAGQRMLALLRLHDPIAVLALGVASDARGLRLETLARNLDDAEAADNAGERRVGRAIAPAGPRTLRTTMPVEHMHEVLREAGVPVAISSHAGTYVCNHVFYVLLLELEQRAGSLPAGFMHVPDPGHPACIELGLDLEGIGRAVDLALEILLAQPAASPSLLGSTP